MPDAAHPAARSVRLVPDPKRAEYWSRFLTELPSVSGSAEEAQFADRLIEELGRAPALASDRFSAWRIPVPGGAPGLACVAALARDRDRATVLLTGHFDTVPVDDYGDLQHLATQPDELRLGLLRRLRASTSSAAERRALADLEGEDFLPGRGLLDMKAGLGAGLAVMEAFLAADGEAGNLLFIAVPDEEVNSVGARAAARTLADLARVRDLDIVAAVNLDATADDADGARGRSVALGTIGKLLPSALVVGQPTHAGYAFNGLAACALAGAIAAEVEWSPELTDRTGDETGAGPTLLGMKDSKTVYNVTTPARVWMYWNVSTHRRTPANVMETLSALVRHALEPLLRRLGRDRAAAGYGGEMPSIEVLTFEQLRASVFAANADAEQALQEYALEVARGKLSLPEQCRLITERLWDLGGSMRPAVIVGFASIPYLPTALGTDRDGAILETATRAAAQDIVERYGQSIVMPRYFLGISDMSYFGQADEAGVHVVAANTPAWRFGVGWPEGDAFGGIPIVNAGPWGRDYHTVLERLHMPYAFEVLPDLVAEICRRVFLAHEESPARA